MEAEKFLIKEFGKERHFRTPNGYFDNLAESIMGRLPEQEARVVNIQRGNNIRKVIAIAACFVGVVCLTGTYLYNMPQKHSQFTSHPSSFLSSYSAANDEFSQVADYMMIDTDDMYAYLADY